MTIINIIKSYKNLFTNIVVESFGFTAVFTGISTFRSCAIQIPKHTETKMENYFKRKFLNDQKKGGEILRKFTYHHQECKNPGGSPSVIFFSHRICKMTNFPKCNQSNLINLMNKEKAFQLHYFESENIFQIVMDNYLKSNKT